MLCNSRTYLIFGAPGMGFSAHRAAAVVLVANTAPVACGAIGTPILTAGTLTGINPHLIGSYVGRQTPVLAFFVPLLLLVLVDGVRGIREIWPAAVVTGAAFSVSQFVSSNYISVELTDIIASLAGLLALVVFLQVWRPAATSTTTARERLAKRAQQDHGEYELIDPRGTGNDGAATKTSTISLVVAAPSAAPGAASPRRSSAGCSRSAGILRLTGAHLAAINDLPIGETQLWTLR